MERGFQKLTFDDGGLIARYILFTPYPVDVSQPQPLIVYLHGAGEAGSDGEKQTTIGLAPVIRAREDEFPFYVLFPQAQRATWRAGSEDAALTLRLVDHVRSLAPIDELRISLTGIAMGAFGVFSLAAAHPERWAAIVPICGGGDPRQARRLVRIPCWCFHGAGDDIFSVEYSREMIAAIREAGGDPIYDEMPGIGHNAWDAAYARPELFDWMYRQRLSERPPRAQRAKRDSAGE